MTAVLVRAILLLAPAPGTGATIVLVALCITAVGLGGYLLLQSAYRCGHFAASLATSTVINPAVFNGAPAPEAAHDRGSPALVG